MKLVLLSVLCLVGLLSVGCRTRYVVAYQPPVTYVTTANQPSPQTVSAPQQVWGTNTGGAVWANTPVSQYVPAPLPPPQVEVVYQPAPVVYGYPYGSCYPYYPTYYYDPYPGPYFYGGARFGVVIGGGHSHHNTHGGSHNNNSPHRR